MKKETGMRAVLFLLTAAFLLLSLLPIFIYRVYGAGVYTLLIFSGFCFFAAASWPKMRKRGKRVVAFVLAAILLLTGLLSAFMVRAAFFAAPSPGGEKTVILLGCQVKGEEPSLMLLRRIQAAAAYLHDNPEATVIVSGGQGPGEAITEAEAMKRELMREGIEEKRIIKEDNSHNTRQNLAYSAEIIREKKLPSQTVMVTDAFHQLRASIYAKREGLLPSAVVAKTPFGLQPAFWVREFFGLFKAGILER